MHAGGFITKKDILYNAVILGVVWHAANNFSVTPSTAVCYYNDCYVLGMLHVHVQINFVYRWAWLCRSTNHIADAARAERCGGPDGVDWPRAVGYVRLLHFSTQVRPQYFNNDNSISYSMLMHSRPTMHIEYVASYLLYTHVMVRTIIKYYLQLYVEHACTIHTMHNGGAFDVSVRSVYVWNNNYCADCSCMLAAGGVLWIVRLVKHW